MMRFVFKYIIILVFSINITACSLSSYPTGEGLLGSLAGAGVGAGVGQLIGDQIGNKTKNTLISAGVGAATGLAIGALIHESRAQIAKEKEMVIREARRINARQAEIDAMRKEIYSQSSWGRLEEKPWHEKYQVDFSEVPYQGYYESRP